MKRELLLVALMVILLTLPPPVSRSAVNGPKPPIGLGFSPTTIEPVTRGTPLFVVGDSVWAESYSPDVLTIVVNSPHGTSSLLNYLEPGGLEELHTFAASDPSGNWSVSVFDDDTDATSYTSFLLVYSNLTLTPQLVGANLTQSDLDLAYSLPPTGAYDMQACTLGAVSRPTSVFALPKSLGTTLEVSLNGSGITVDAPGLKAPASVWTDIDATRSYRNGTSILSEESLAAQTDVATTNGSPLEEPLAQDLSLRVGRYDLRFYFRSSSGLLLFEAPYLLTGEGAWISLQTCGQLLNVNSNSFEMAANLVMAPSTWPRTLLLMYSDDGIDASTQSNISALVARVQLLAYSPGKVSGVGATASGSAVADWDSYNGSVYLIGASFPLQARFDVQYEGISTDSIGMTLNSPYSVYNLGAPDGEATLQSSLNGSPLANSTISLSAQGGTPLPFKTDGHGNLTLTLPPGDYNLTASYDDYTSALSMGVGANSTSSGVLDFGSPAPSLLVIGLAVVAVAAAGVNVILWIDIIRKKRLSERGLHN